MILIMFIRINYHFDYHFDKFDEANKSFKIESLPCDTEYTDCPVFDIAKL